jgi:signal transduction histidine kinase
MIKIKNYFEQTIDDIRRMSNDLAPTVLKEFGLLTALRNLCRNLTNQSGVNIHFTNTEYLPKLSPKTEIYLYRIVQEALSNSVKHARASHVQVSLSIKNENISLLITDDGAGFEIEKIKKCSGNGINNIYERARILDARIQIDTAPGKGTQITLELKTINT